MPFCSAALYSSFSGWMAAVYTTRSISSVIFSATCPKKTLAPKETQFFGDIGGTDVGTGNSKSFFEKDFGKTAHADAADPHKMNMNWFLEIYLIHRNS